MDHYKARFPLVIFCLKERARKYDHVAQLDNFAFPQEVFSVRFCLWKS